VAGRLEGKVVVITGAGGGMGREAALLFSAEGASVCVADVDGGAAEATAREAREAFAFEVDVADAPSVEAMYATTGERYGGIDVLYNNAGISPADDGSILETGADAWRGRRRRRSRTRPRRARCSRSRASSACSSHARVCA
jgi:NAD(P)-dependent dehydrogenase (short-subunit alcohol dehydrogenase family)